MRILPHEVEKFWNFGPGRTALASFCAHSVSISIGICQGYSAILIPQLISSDKFSITSEESSWLASLGAVTNPIGSIISGFLAEYLGRKASIQISSIPLFIGWMTIGFANNLTALYVGRLLTGITVGMSAASFTYVSEISTSENRGIFQALGPICASLGILLTYTLGYYIEWSTVAFISILFAFFTLISVQFLPESPEYLIKRERKIESFNSYLWFRRNNQIAQQEMDKYEGKIEKNCKDVYFSSVTVRPLLILVVLFLLQELSGIYTILYYAVNFFEKTNLDINDYVSSIIVGIIRFVMSIVGAFLINKLGRKILCITSSAGMSLTMLVMTIYFKYYEINSNETRIFNLLPLICIIFNVFFSMIGMLPIPFILVGELFPLEVRSIMCGIVICIAQCFIFICIKMYPYMILYLNFSGTLSTFLVGSILALLFCKFFLVETKNKSLKEIEDYFRKHNKKEDPKEYNNRAFEIKNEPLFVVQISS